MTDSPRRIKVWTCLPSFELGGAERLSIDLMRGLDPTTFETAFGCLRKWGDLLPEAERDMVVRAYPVRTLYPPGPFRQQFRLARDLRQQRVDIIHSHNFSANVLTIPAARLARVPVVVASVHDHGVYQSPLQQRVHARMCRLADRVFVVAESIRTWLVAKGCDAGRVSVLRNGIDLSRFRTSGDDRAVRAELRLPDAAPVAMMISRLVPFKGLEDFVTAAGQVARLLPDVRFLIVGEGYVNRGDGSMSEHREYRQQLEQMAARLGVRDRIVFTGFRPDVARLLQSAAVTVLPSLSEGLSNVVLESMAAGVPVIASRVGGIPEALTDGVTGLLVPPSDPTAVAAAMCRILGDADLATRIGEAGRRHVAEHFSMDRMIAETTAWYLRLLRESPGGLRHPLSADCAGFQKRPA